MGGSKAVLTTYLLSTQLLAIVWFFQFHEVAQVAIINKMI
jgi:hypothetical protein